MEEERKGRISASAGKRKLEGDIKELEAQLDQANRIKEDGLKQLKKYQNQLKEVQRDLDDARQSRDDLSSQVKNCSLLFELLDAGFCQFWHWRGCSRKWKRKFF